MLDLSVDFRALFGFRICKMGLAWPSGKRDFSIQGEGMAVVSRPQRPQGLAFSKAASFGHAQKCARSFCMSYKVKARNCIWHI